MPEGVALQRMVLPGLDAGDRGVPESEHGPGCILEEVGLQLDEEELEFND